jgi:hypothetical protein
MSTRDGPVEGALRDLYRSRDPGHVPATLRAVVDAIPDTALPEPTALGRPRGTLLGLAAALALLAVGFAALRAIPLESGGGAPAVTPGPTFDPTISGPGLVAPASTSGQWLLVLLAAAGLALGSWALVRRRRRLLAAVPGVLAVVAVGYGLLASYGPIDLRTQGWGTGISVVLADKPPGSLEDIFYVVAKPGQPFSFAVFLAHPSGLLPFIVEGVVSPPEAAAPRIAAAWADQLKDGGAIGPAAPFEPTDLAGPNGQTIWIVGRAGECALGTAPTTTNSMTGLSPLKLRVSVLGWPRDVELSGVPSVWEAADPGCDPALETPPPASPSGR